MIPNNGTVILLFTEVILWTICTANLLSAVEDRRVKVSLRPGSNTKLLYYITVNPKP